MKTILKKKKTCCSNIRTLAWVFLNSSDEARDWSRIWRNSWSRKRFSCSSAPLVRLKVSNSSSKFCFSISNFPKWRYLNDEKKKEKEYVLRRSSSNAIVKPWFSLDNCLNWDDVCTRLRSNSERSCSAWYERLTNVEFLFTCSRVYWELRKQFC